MPAVNTAEKSASQRRWLWVAIFVGAWTALALLAAAEIYVSQQLWDKPVSWTLAIRRSFKEFYSYAFLSLGVLWLCKRWWSLNGMRWFLPHMAAAILIAFAHVTLVSWLEAGEISVQNGQVLTFSHLFGKLAVNYTISNLFKYWILVLGHLGWQYYRSYRERERQAAALATELVQARLQALRMQINPHFLFNTLHTISSLIHSQPETADRMIARLSELLRSTLDHGETQEVPLREEIDFLKRYLEIEQLRFADRLAVTFDIGAQTEELLVPHLILQPLVENALRHGLEPREEPGRVEISSRVIEGNSLELKVCDDGVGLSANGQPLDRGGIGLKNIRSRLTHLYGKAQSFEIHNVPGGGVEAIVRLPCCTTPRSQAARVVVMSAGEAVNSPAAMAATAAVKSSNG